MANSTETDQQEPEVVEEEIDFLLKAEEIRILIGEHQRVRLELEETKRKYEGLNLMLKGAQLAFPEAFKAEEVKDGE